MPFRRWLASRGIQHPGAYSMVMLALGVVVCMAVSVWISVQASNRALEREREQRNAARQATCMVVRRMIEVYSDPTTPTGVNAQGAWTDLGRIFHC